MIIRMHNALQLSVCGAVGGAHTGVVVSGLWNHGTTED